MIPGTSEKNAWKGNSISVNEESEKVKEELGSEVSSFENDFVNGYYDLKMEDML